MAACVLAMTGFDQSARNRECRRIERQPWNRLLRMPRTRRSLRRSACKRRGERRTRGKAAVDRGSIDVSPGSLEMKRTNRKWVMSSALPVLGVLGLAAIPDAHAAVTWFVSQEVGG